MQGYDLFKGSGALQKYNYNRWLEPKLTVGIVIRFIQMYDKQ